MTADLYSKQRAFISGCKGPVLTDEEREFFAHYKPWGLILFSRNCLNHQQIKQLTSDFCELVAEANAPVLIDQEGGRVQRLKPPLWSQYPTSQKLANIYKNDPQHGKLLVRDISRLIAKDLIELGINVNCMPVLDLYVPGAHDIIGDRAYGDTPNIITTLAKEAASGLIDLGVLPIIKHIPGHGRAKVDSHVELPIIDSQHEVLSNTDFKPFKNLNNMPMAMTAHIIYSQIDPHNPATQSNIIINHIIRKEIGFNGLLMSDDLSMQALTGSMKERATATIEAGCDIILHCNGSISEMQEVAESTPLLSGISLQRSQKAMNSAINKPSTVINFDISMQLDNFDAFIN